MTPARARVDVATVWASPAAPRAVDAPALADTPDLEDWLAPQSAKVRRELHGRILTQLLQDEPVDVLVEEGDWARIRAPWQPNPTDHGGYVGWVRRAHLVPAESSHGLGPVGPVPAERLAVMAQARRFIGVGYLWGGMSPYGFDCSGLVHYAYRQAGVVVPRDAAAQAHACRAVRLGTERPGDLYFFAHEDGGVFHVGFVTGEHTMLHAPETGSRVEDAPLASGRVSSLLAAGRFLDPA